MMLKEPLARDNILHGLDAVSQTRISTLEVFERLDSTNQYLQNHHLPQGAVCLAEYQSAGRGQQGRRWVSPEGSGLCLSLSWRLTQLPPALSLVLAIATVQVLEALGAQQVKIKWPNDIVWQDKKLAGLLLESRYISAQWGLVIGLGMNVHPLDISPDLSASEVPAQAPIDLSTVLGSVPSRNQLATAVIAHFADILSHPIEFSVYQTEWARLDALAHRAVTVFSAGQAYQGTARGVDAQGALCLETEHGERRCFNSASVRVSNVNRA